MRRLRVLLDANVIVDAQVRDFFLTLAEAELIDVRWSAEILEEVRRAILKRVQISPSKVEQLFAAMARAFPGAEVTDYSHLTEELHLPDHDDRHVLAAAIRGECELLVTFNTRDFPTEATVGADLQVLSPDEAVFILAGIFPESIATVLTTLIARLKHPSMTAEAYLQRLTDRAPNGAAALGAALGIETYEQVFQDIVLAESSSSAQSAVRQLIWAVTEGDAASTAALVHHELARSMAGKETPLADEVHGVLRERLDDVVTQEGWGIARTRRLHGPDTELVKVVREGDDPSVPFEQQHVSGHLFSMRLTDDGWVLVELDGPDPVLEDG